MLDNHTGLSREHSVEDKWANRALTAEMEVGRLTVRLEKNIAGWAAEQKDRLLAERKLTRAMIFVRLVLAGKFDHRNGEPFFGEKASITLQEITAMDNEESVKQMREGETEKPALHHALGSVHTQDEIDELLSVAGMKSREENQNTETLNQEPEPDHEAARNIAKKALISPLALWSRRILARAYLALSDELAALKEKVGKESKCNCYICSLHKDNPFRGHPFEETPDA